MERRPDDQSAAAQCCARLCLTTRAWSLGLLLIALLVGPPRHAQVAPRAFSWGVAAGPAIQTTTLDGHLRRLGASASAFLRWSVSSRAALTLDALGSYFAYGSNHVHGPCPPEAGPFACHEPVGAVSVGALAVGLQWADSAAAAGGRGTYGLLGGGLYRALKHPTAAGATRLGWTAGLGFILRPTTPRLAVEVRYHHVPRWPSERLNVIPITLALSW
jgi:hypothetical protein